jgi:hypothetical protein
MFTPSIYPLESEKTHNPFHVLALAAAAEIQETGGPKADHQRKR